jgi:hypothetical protein
MVVRKKNGKICLCVDFKDINRKIIKYNYALPNMEMLLQLVTGFALMSMLDVFSRYNQFLVDKEDIQIISFITPWATRAYVRIPFGLKNAGETFQRAMDHAFKDLIRTFMENYQVDLRAHSKLREIHLKQVFER